MASWAATRLHSSTCRRTNIDVRRPSRPTQHRTSRSSSIALFRVVTALSEYIFNSGHLIDADKVCGSPRGIASAASLCVRVCVCVCVCTFVCVRLCVCTVCTVCTVCVCTTRRRYKTLDVQPTQSTLALASRRNTTTCRGARLFAWRR